MSFVHSYKPTHKYKHLFKCDALDHESKKNFVKKLKDFYKDNVKMYSTSMHFYIFFKLDSDAAMFKLFHKDEKLKYDKTVYRGQTMSITWFDGFEKISK